ncbi:MULTISPECIES: hypothetical protein [Streptomyces]|uniref:Uncharacterized protein n=1 Tax=Streptomyces flaveolus TaxID=67297 RepID=A0ABV3AHV8_9ACTN|nr:MULTISPECIES: hypothetical protein [Streptomyces]
MPTRPPPRSRTAIRWTRTATWGLTAFSNALVLVVCGTLALYVLGRRRLIGGLTAGFGR